MELITILLDDIKSVRFNKELLLQQNILLDRGTEIVEYYENMIPFDVPLENILKNMTI